MLSPSRRDVLAAGGGLLAGLVGGYVARPRLAAESPPDPTPLAWADTEWPYPDYDAARTRNPPPESAPEDDLAVDWRREFDNGFERAPPVAANGRLFTASSDSYGAALAAYALADGGRAWERRATGDPTNSPRVLAPGSAVYYWFHEFDEWSLGAVAASTGEHAWGRPESPRANWTVGAGRLYRGDRGDGTLAAHDARTGDVLWTADVDEEWLDVRAFHPAVGVLATSRRTMYALDPTDGSRLWTLPLDSHVRSGPAATDEVVFVATWDPDVNLVALDAESGDDLWRYPLTPSVVETEEGQAARWYELGAATGDVVVVRERHADPTSGALHAVDAASGDRVWRVEPPEGARLFSEPTVVDGSVYVCTGDDHTELQRRDLADGALTGSWSLPGYVESPVVTDGRVLAQTPTALLAFA